MLFKAFRDQGQKPIKKPQPSPSARSSHSSLLENDITNHRNQISFAHGNGISDSDINQIEATEKLRLKKYQKVVFIVSFLAFIPFYAARKAFSK